MGAVFPNGIKSFITHKNLTDDVKAEHINAIQDEVTAIEAVLGPLVNEVHEVVSEVTSLDSQVATIDQDIVDLNGDLNNVEGQVGGINSKVADLSNALALNDAGDAVERTQFSSLDERLRWIEDGMHMYGIELSRSNFDVPRMFYGLDGNIPQSIRMDAPTPETDPRGMYNGWGFTLKRSGLWLLQGNVTWEITPTWRFDNEGDYGAAVLINNQFYGRAYQRDLYYGRWAFPYFFNRYFYNERRNVFLNPSTVGYFPAGTRVSLGAGHDSRRNQYIREATLSGIRLRD